MFGSSSNQYACQVCLDTATPGESVKFHRHHSSFFYKKWHLEQGHKELKCPTCKIVYPIEPDVHLEANLPAFSNLFRKKLRKCLSGFSLRWTWQKRCQILLRGLGGFFACFGRTFFAWHEGCFFHCYTLWCAEAMRPKKSHIFRICDFFRPTAYMRSIWHRPNSTLCKFFAFAWKFWF